MSPSRKIRSSIISRPWFAAFAMAFGISTMAVAGYVTEKPLAFTSNLASSASSPTKVAAAHQAALPDSVPETAPLVINVPEMRIESNSSHRMTRKTAQVDACIPTGWRSLETGPATRQVRGFCSIPGGSRLQPRPSSNLDNGEVEHLMVPRPVLGHLDLAE